MLKTDQYKTSKHGYVTKTQQQKGLAKFLQNSKLISLVGQDWMRKSATPAGDTYTPLLLRPERSVHTNPVTVFKAQVIVKSVLQPQIISVVLFYIKWLRQ